MNDQLTFPEVAAAIAARMAAAVTSSDRVPPRTLLPLLDELAHHVSGDRWRGMAILAEVITRLDELVGAGAARNLRHDITAYFRRRVGTSRAEPPRPFQELRGQLQQQLVDVAVLLRRSRWPPHQGPALEQAVAVGRAGIAIDTAVQELSNAAAP